MSRMSRAREPMRPNSGRSPKGGKPTGTPRGMRRMVVRGEDWYWSFGSDVRIVDPQGRRHDIPITTFSGYTHDDLERAEWKGNGYDLTPRKIRDWIDRRILGYTDIGGMPAGAIPKDWTQATQNGHSFVSGPRGIWRWRMAPVTEQGRMRRPGRGLPNVQIVSPEEVSTYHRVYEVTGQGVEAFFATQRASLVECGVDLSVRVEDPIGQIMCHPLPVDSRPTDRHVRDYIVNTITAPAPVAVEAFEGSEA
jgi:hypothetical protein